MKSLDSPGQPACPRWLRVFAPALPVLLSAGCASPRPPRPPSLNLPEIVKDLTAQRIGDQVLLRWTTPDKTTDHLDLKGAVTAQICRIDRADAHPLPPCNVIARPTVAPGASQQIDILPPPLTTGQPVLLAYRVQLFNAHGRSAGPSRRTFAAAGAAPPPVQQLRAKPVPSGVQLQWQRDNSIASIELDRLLISPPVTPPSHLNHPVSSKPSKDSSPPAHPRSKTRSSHAATPKSVNTSPPNQVKLQTPPPTPGHTPNAGEIRDPGGTIDASALMGETYTYTAQRLATATLDGHALTLRSPASAPVTVAVRDLFPPAIPTGLEAVPGGVAVSESSIDLSWTPNTDLDLAGYFVYRQNVSPDGAAAGVSIRLNQTPIPGPAWRDSTAAPGQRYAYRVTAVDASGNESAPSAAVQESLRNP